MKLAGLHPRWMESPDGRKIAIEFDCPTHPNGDCKMFVPFTDPRTGGTQMYAWRKEGETFETLTLSPSIQYVGHWHGHVLNGEIVTSPDSPGP